MEQQTTAASDGRSMTRRRYDKVNGRWPDTLPALTAKEARAAASRLWRKFVGGAYHRGASTQGGWDGLVHRLSHRAHRRLHPGKAPHHFSHAWLEREMIDHVISSGWLDGALQRRVKTKPPRDVKAERHQRIIARIASWSTKLKRAQNALKKLKRQMAYYERTLATVQ